MQLISYLTIPKTGYCYINTIITLMLHLNHLEITPYNIQKHKFQIETNEYRLLRLVNVSIVKSTLQYIKHSLYSLLTTEYSL